MNSEQIKERLEQIAQEMKKPHANIEKLSQEIDRLLGTSLEAEDKHLASAWERSRGRR